MDGFDQDAYYDGRDLDEAEDDFLDMFEETDLDGFDEDFSDIDDDDEDEFEDDPLEEDPLEDEFEDDL